MKKIILFHTEVLETDHKAIQILGLREWYYTRRQRNILGL